MFPNPAKDYIITEYRKNDSNEEVILEMIDFNGKIVRSYNLPKTENQQLISLQGLSGGTYFINLYKNNSFKGAYKVIVIR
ncbi:MAG: T9SS type A sorting domain-containing protein [Bacteroidales bacterium]|nr:T9SS type A sorting domain-containing protein [Bacteroidales bacterium]MBP9511501.1 T9SS type A sorting domain-containing protein [Bacteroidales bacterium]MBP9588229.1 T9SS type A sorting domain-containing protein [Bacteroidales bacterium]